MVWSSNVRGYVRLPMCTRCFAAYGRAGHIEGIAGGPVW
jgi:hypothetical protein